jgi:hypothetical protein
MWPLNSWEITIQAFSTEEATPSRRPLVEKNRNKDFEFDGSKAGNILLPHPLPCMRGGIPHIHISGLD